MRVQSGYPVWNLIELWLTAGFDDSTVAEGYSDMPAAEWQAAKQYYLDHKPFIDARIIANTQPAADDDIPPVQTAEEYFAWLARQSATEPATDGFGGHG